MNRDTLIVFALAIGGFCGVAAGWVFAHAEIATECKRQSGFYVGREDFVCSLKEKK